MFRALALSLLVICLSLLTVSPSSAHPHAWIDLRSRIITNEAGKVIGIEQEWLFDAFYSLFVVEGIEVPEAEQKAALTELARTNLQNLREYDYFTQAQVGKDAIAFGEVDTYESEMHSGRLWMRFVVPFETPVDLLAGGLSYSVYDPTYYIEILHTEGDVISFVGGLEGNCAAWVVPPNPNMETVMLAQAMDRDATPDYGLGAVFAERVEVSCR